MSGRRTHITVALLLVLGSLLFTPFDAFADETRLPAQSNREVWRRGGDEVVKDFEWTFTPVLNAQADQTDIRIDSTLVKHADNFASVTGEMAFCCGLDQTLQLRFDDGISTEVAGASAHLTAADMAQHRLVGFSLVSRIAGAEWTLDWDASSALAATEPDPPLAYRGAPVEPAGAPGQGDKRGTYLTASDLTDYQQQIDGLWMITGSGASSPPSGPNNGYLRFSFLDDAGKLVLMAGGFPPRYHSDYTPFERTPLGSSDGTLGQYSGGTETFDGLRSTIEQDAQLCPQYQWWSPAHLVFNAVHIHADETAADKTHDNTCSITGDAPNLQVSYQRLLGVTFVPLIPGKFMSLAGAPAVGDQAAQFKASVALAWDYSGAGVARMVLHVRRPGGGDSPRDYPNPGQGQYQLIADRPGLYEFEFQLFDANGGSIHSDRAAALIPSLPGIR